MGFAAIYAVLLIRGWSSYNGEQRTPKISLILVFSVWTDVSPSFKYRMCGHSITLHIRRLFYRTVLDVLETLLLHLYGATYGLILGSSFAFVYGSMVFALPLYFFVKSVSSTSPFLYVFAPINAFRRVRYICYLSTQLTLQ